MYPVDFYRTVQGDRHAWLGRLRRPRDRRAPGGTGVRVRTPGAPVTVPGPQGPVVLSPHGVTRVGGLTELSHRA